MDGKRCQQIQENDRGRGTLGVWLRASKQAVTDGARGGAER